LFLFVGRLRYLAGMLRDDVFLLAHDDDGRLLIAEPVVSAGLAGAMLIDLLVTDRVAVMEGRLRVVDPTPTGDAELDATLEAVAATTEPTGPRAWVSWISAGAYERTAAALDAAGIVQRTTIRRLGLVPVSRCLPTKPDDLVRLRSRLRFGVHATDAPDAATAALAGLVRVLGLHGALLLSMPSVALRAELDRLARTSTTTVRQVIKAVDTLITAAAYR
jgi:hypothetical protein